MVTVRSQHHPQGVRRGQTETKGPVVSTARVRHVSELPPALRHLSRLRRFLSPLRLSRYPGLAPLKAGQSARLILGQECTKTHRARNFCRSLGVQAKGTIYAGEERECAPKRRQPAHERRHDHAFYETHGGGARSGDRRAFFLGRRRGAQSAPPRWWGRRRGRDFRLRSRSPDCRRAGTAALPGLLLRTGASLCRAAAPAGSLSAPVPSISQRPSIMRARSPGHRDGTTIATRATGRSIHARATSSALTGSITSASDVLTN